jgi:hypothetical protein
VLDTLPVYHGGGARILLAGGRISSVLRQKVLSRILETFQEKQKTDFSGKERRLVKTNNTEL